MNRLIFAIALLLLTGCGVLPKRELIKIFEPAAPLNPDRTEGPVVTWSLLVARPICGQALDTERISVRPTPGQIEVYKGVSWSDNLPDLVQTTLIRRFEDSGKIIAVARPGAGVRGEYLLSTEVRAFEAIYAGAGAPAAVIELQVKLIRNSDGKVIAMNGFRESQQADSEAIGPVVEAFSQALNRVNSQLVGWTLSNGQQFETQASKP